MENFKTRKEVHEAGYGKFAEDRSYSHTRAGFYNPETKDVVWIVVSDVEDSRNDNWELYHMPIDTEFLRRFQIDNGIIFEGATVEVFKGRKVPIGTIAIVEKISDGDFMD